MKHGSCSATVLNESAPPNFYIFLYFISVCRTFRRGGGVAALFKDVYQCKQVSFGQCLSFEYLGIVLKGALRILFIIIYRPPKYSPAFVEEFTELLSMISSEFDCFAIAGDFNIHIDNAEIKTTKVIINVLNTFDLSQLVYGTTHKRVRGRGGFNLLAPRKNVVTALSLPTDRPVIGAWKAAMAAV